MNQIYVPKRHNFDVIRRWLLKYSHLSTEELARKSGLSTKKIIEWKIYCDVIDPKDEKLLKLWLRYKDYSLTEVCIILNLTLDQFMRYTRKYKIDKYRGRQFAPSKKRPPKKYDRIPLPNKADLVRLLEKHGSTAIAKMCGVWPRTITRLMDKFDVKSPRRLYEPMVHECNNKEWLMENYVKKGYATIKCAELAGVKSDHTIRRWLIKHKIRPRTNGCF